jgi:hypothetical protein
MAFLGPTALPGSPYFPNAVSGDASLLKGIKKNRTFSSPLAIPGSTY